MCQKNPIHSAHERVRVLPIAVDFVHRQFPEFHSNEPTDPHKRQCFIDTMQRTLLRWCEPKTRWDATNVNISFCFRNTAPYYRFHASQFLRIRSHHSICAHHIDLMHSIWRRRHIRYTHMQCLILAKVIHYLQPTERMDIHIKYSTRSIIFGIQQRFLVRSI